MDQIVLKGRKVHGGSFEGEAVVSKMGMAFYGSINAYTGKVVEPGHDLQGKEIAGRIVVFKSGKGSSAFTIGAQALRFLGNIPKALVVKKSNPQVALGAVIMGIPVVADMEKDPTEIIETGDWVKVDGDKGVVEITKRNK